MIIKAEGVVLSQRNYRDSEKYLTILTKEYGLIETAFRVFGQVKRAAYQSLGVCGYYRFDLFVNKNRYSVNAIEKIEDFFGLRYDVEKLALAGYFCELTQSLVPPRELAWVYLRLLLNTLHLLEQDKRTQEFLKAVFELRVMAISGFMPNLVCCRSCCAYQKPNMYFLPLSGELVCSDCLDPMSREIKALVSPTVLNAMRYIIYKDFEQLYGFSLDKEPLRQLGTITEFYLLSRIEREFKSLDLYHQLHREEP